MLASLKPEEDGHTELDHLIEGYKLCAGSEGKSRNTIDIVTNSVKYFYEFLCSTHRPTDVKYIGTQEIRAFALYLQQKRCFSNHPCSRIQDRGLSSHTVNCYLRSLRAFWGWLLAEEIIETNPFTKVRLPRTSRKVTPTFSDHQVLRLLAVIDHQVPQGYRDYAIVLTLVDTALRVSELTAIKMDDLRLNEGLIRVLGKGRKERLVPIGRQLQRVIWRYIERYRPQPLNQNLNFVFLTKDGKQMSKGRLESIIKKYGE